MSLLVYTVRHNIYCCLIGDAANTEFHLSLISKLLYCYLEVCVSYIFPRLRKDKVYHIISYPVSHSWVILSRRNCHLNETIFPVHSVKTKFNFVYSSGILEDNSVFYISSVLNFDSCRSIEFSKYDLCLYSDGWIYSADGRNIPLP